MNSHEMAASGSLAWLGMMNPWQSWGWISPGKYKNQQIIILQRGKSTITIKTLIDIHEYFMSNYVYQHEDTQHQLNMAWLFASLFKVNFPGNPAWKISFFARPVWRTPVSWRMPVAPRGRLPASIRSLARFNDGFTIWNTKNPAEFLRFAGDAGRKSGKTGMKTGESLGFLSIMMYRMGIW